MCFICDEGEENGMHIFKNCQAIRALAFATHWGCRLDAWEFEDMRSWLNFCIKPNTRLRLQGKEAKFFTLFKASLFYSMWLYRNNLMFDGKSNLLSSAQKLEFSVSEFAQSRIIEETLVECSQDLQGPKAWQPPPEGWIKINVDAGLMDSYTALAMVVRDHRGELLFLVTKLIERRVPYVVELQALQWATNYVKSYSQNKILWAMDTVNVMDDVKMELNPNGQESAHLLRQIQIGSWIGFLVRLTSWQMQLPLLYLL